MLLGRPRCRWENNINMDPKGIVFDAAHRIDVTQDRDQFWALMNTVMNLLISEKAGYFWNSFGTIKF
jgi:hypothetical protein